MAKAKLTKNQKEWVKALRSGKYKQTRDKLKSRSGAYCCLGVAEVLAGSPVKFERGEYFFGDPGTADYNETSLTKRGAEWLGLPMDVEAPYLDVPREHELRDYNDFRPSVIELNDTRRLSFKQIADLVEEFGLVDTA